MVGFLQLTMVSWLWRLILTNRGVAFSCNSTELYYALVHSQAPSSCLHSVCVFLIMYVVTTEKYFLYVGVKYCCS